MDVHRLEHFKSSSLTKYRFLQDIKLYDGM